MIPSHAELYERLSPAQTARLQSHLQQRGLVPPTTPPADDGPTLAQHLASVSHVDVVLACADRVGEEWESILCALLHQPMYRCAPGETAFPPTDIRGRPLRTPIGARLGEAPTTQLPVQVRRRAIRTAPVRSDPRIIDEVQLPNPKAPGSAAHARYELYREGMAVAEYLALGGRREDIRYDTHRGFIVVRMPDKVRPRPPIPG